MIVLDIDIDNVNRLHSILFAIIEFCNKQDFYVEKLNKNRRRLPSNTWSYTRSSTVIMMSNCPL